MKFIILLILIPSFEHCNGQEITLVNTNETELIYGYPNRLKVKASGLDCSWISVSSRDGDVRLDSCTLVIIPKYPNSVKLFFYKYSQTDTTLLTIRNFIVRKLADPVPSLYKRSSGTMTSNLIAGGQIHLENIGHSYVGCGINFPPIESFKIISIRDNQLQGYAFNVGPEFTIKSLELIRELEPGDQIIFFDILGTNYYKEKVILSTMKFEIK